MYSLPITASYWPFVRGIHQSPAEETIETPVRRHHADYGGTVMLHATRAPYKLSHPLSQRILTLTLVLSDYFE